MFVIEDIMQFVNAAHSASHAAGWWHTSERYHPEGIRDPLPDPDRLTVPTKLCLIHSEITEAYRGWLYRAPDEHLPEWSSLAIECADVAIRIGDLAGYLQYDMQAAINSVIDFDGEITMSDRAAAEMHGHVDDAMEAYRKGRPGVPETLAKVLLTLRRISYEHGFDLSGAIAAKMAYNAVRPDHKLEARGADGGKTF